MFGFLKQLKQLKKSMTDQLEQSHRYLEMSSSELQQLSDSELFQAALTRTEDKVDQYENSTDGIKTLSHAEQVFYVTSLYEMEVLNGGLCQYFVNSSRETAPQLSEALAEIGAVEHQALFDRFIQENEIDVFDLSSFKIAKLKDYQAQAERYPFEAFDNAFMELKPIQDILPSYVRIKLDEF